jgi:hypothetical protein
VGRAAYQIGAFGTHRLSLGLGHRPARRGFFVHGRGFVDAARNDYPVHVGVADLSGAKTEVTRRRFHDRYRAQGAIVDLGAEGLRLADRASVRLFVTHYDRDLQNNFVMTVPYGEPTYEQLALGASVHHRLRLRRIDLDSTVGHTFSELTLLDASTCRRYDWNGVCVRELSTVGGELDGTAHDRTYDQQSTYARLFAEAHVARRQELRFAFAPTFTRRTGEERIVPSTALRNPLDGARRVFTAMLGAEYELRAFDERLEARAFVKGYLFRSSSESVTPNGGLDETRRDLFAPGGGAALRFEVTDSLLVKASYERALRFPSPDEIFGDMVLVQANYGILPERSHNTNLGLRFDGPEGRLGALRAELVGFARLSDDLIFLIGKDRDIRYNNIARGRSLGGELSVEWALPRGWGLLRGDVTLNDFRNTSTTGEFAYRRGDRMPNRPYVYGTLEARIRWRELTQPRDALVLDLTTRFVGGFYRFWESSGAADTKERIGRQIVSTVALGYEVRGAKLDLSATIEVQNLFNAQVYDFYGVERPGRAAYAKLALRFGA